MLLLHIPYKNTSLNIFFLFPPLFKALYICQDMAYASNAVLEHVIRETCMLSTAPLNCGKDLKMRLLWAVLNTINSKKSMNCLWLKRTRAKWKSSICLGFKALNVCFLCSFFVCFHSTTTFLSTFNTAILKQQKKTIQNLLTIIQWSFFCPSLSLLNLMCAALVSHW